MVKKRTKRHVGVVDLTRQFVGIFVLKFWQIKVNVKRIYSTWKSFVLIDKKKKSSSEFYIAKVNLLLCDDCSYFLKLHVRRFAKKPTLKLYRATFDICLDHDHLFIHIKRIESIKTCILKRRKKERKKIAV